MVEAAAEGEGEEQGGEGEVGAGEDRGDPPGGTSRHGDHYSERCYRVPRSHWLIKLCVNC